MTGLPPLHQPVRPEWVDYNGHLSEAFYVLVFGYATDALMEQVGLDEAYRTRSGCSLYTVEAHVRYLREVGPDAEMTVTSRIVDCSAKKLRICHEMTVDGITRATEEVLALHVDSTQGRATPFPEPVAAHLAELTEPAPDYAGRSIS